MQWVGAWAKDDLFTDFLSYQGVKCVEDPALI